MSHRFRNGSLGDCEKGFTNAGDLAVPIGLAQVDARVPVWWECLNGWRWLIDIKCPLGTDAVARATMDQEAKMRRTHPTRK